MQQDFVIVSVSPWDFEYGSNIKDIALEISKTHRVMFVNIPLKFTEALSGNLTWSTKRNKVIKSLSNDLEKINDNLHVLTTPVLIFPINRVKNRRLFNLLNGINNRLYAGAIKRGIKALGLKNITLINDNDFCSAQNLPRLIKAKISAYYLRDNFSAMAYWKSSAPHAEPKTIFNYDLTLSNSTYLARFAAKQGKPAHYVGQGCDVSFFSKETDSQNIPADLAKISRPTVGYVGALNSERLDIKLIKHIAENNKDKSVVLVGPEDTAFTNSSLHDMPNVHFLGSKDFSELLDYMANFDVCINPQHVNDITVGNYPRKIDEYLAVGKPVVATYTETMEPFQPVCYLAKNGEHYVELINQAINEDSKDKQKKRRIFAQSHTWENSVTEMLKHL